MTDLHDQDEQDGLHDLLEAEVRRYTMPDDALDRLMAFRSRKRRNQRITSGLVALAVFGAGLAGVLALVRGGHHTRPAISPIPRPPESSVPRALEGPLTPAGTIQFVNASTGWVAWGGQILATFDGGHTWTGYSTGPFHVDALQFVDDRHGWALSVGGRLLRTTDSGVHWSVAPEPTQPLRTIEFVTANVGWGVSGPADVAAPGVLVRSIDGGGTWQQVGMPGAVDSVCFADATIGWVVSGTTLRHTVDGGTTWETSTLRVPGGEPWVGNVRCAGIDAWVELQGGGAAGHAAYVLFRTTEGGPSAEPVLQDAFAAQAGPHVFGAEDPYAGPFTALDGLRAFVTGTCPQCGSGTTTLYVTSNADRVSWLGLPVTTREQSGIAQGISFVDPNRGWIQVERAGPKGPELHILGTTDAGRTWRDLSEG